MKASLVLSLAALTLLWCVPAGAQTPKSGSPEAKLAELGLTLPPTGNPVANYVPAVRSGSLIFLAGHVSRGADGKVIAGKVGRDATEQQANAAAKQTALGLLATLKREIGDLAKVKRIVRVGGFVNAVDDFKTQSQVMNGCSDVMVSVFGDAGRHARSAVGMANLPMGFAVEVDGLFEIE